MQEIKTEYQTDLNIHLSVRDDETGDGVKYIVLSTDGNDIALTVKDIQHLLKFAQQKESALKPKTVEGYVRPNEIDALIEEATVLSRQMDSFAEPWCTDFYFDKAYEFVDDVLRGLIYEKYKQNNNE